MSLKTLNALLVVLIFVISTAAQSFRDEELSTEFVFLRRNVEVAIPNRNVFTPDKLNDSAGFRIGYTHFFGRKNGRGNLGIGVEGGATFHNLNNSTVSLARAQYKLVYQANGGDKKFRPSVKATVGGARENLKENVACPTGGGGFALCSPEWTPTFGAGVGFDVGKTRRRLRVGFECFTTAFYNNRQFNCEASVGAVW